VLVVHELNMVTKTSDGCKLALVEVCAEAGGGCKDTQEGLENVDVMDQRHHEHYQVIGIKAKCSI
jgi:hypothetical protein